MTVDQLKKQKVIITTVFAYRKDGTWLGMATYKIKDGKAMWSISYHKGVSVECYKYESVKSIFKGRGATKFLSQTQSYSHGINQN